MLYQEPVYMLYLTHGVKSLIHLRPAGPVGSGAASLLPYVKSHLRALPSVPGPCGANTHTPPIAAAPCFLFLTL